jgi:hypothetical protein
LYEVSVKVAPVEKARWKAICTDCAGGIDSLVELLQGKLSKGVMERICSQGKGLFPGPRDIKLSCSCPDSAVMCKHVAAVLYGIGARFDEQPELLFRLRAVDEMELIANAGTAAAPLVTRGPAASKVLQDADLSDVFGLDILQDAGGGEVVDRKPVAAKRARKRPDPLVTAIEVALQPERLIPYEETDWFFGELRELEAQIAKIRKTEPERAVRLYETLIKGCELKAEEIDDSDGELETFGGELFGGWITARQAAGADRGETAKRLLAWMEADDYGLCNDLESAAVKALDREGLDAFEREIQVRFDAASTKRKGRSSYDSDRWGGMLERILLERGRVGKYIELTGRRGLTLSDCDAIATMLHAQKQPGEALAWVERGLAMEDGAGLRSDFAKRKLGEMRRALLIELNRGGEALELAWSEFEKAPSAFAYLEFMKLLRKADRGVWRARAMEAAAGQSNLGLLIELLLEAGEVERLAATLDRATLEELAGLSHYTTEPAAEYLAYSHPGVAGKVFRVLCLRILDAGKSQYYRAAMLHAERARDCYRDAGLDGEWQEFVATVRRAHSRKSGFLPGFDRIAREVTGKGMGKRPR